MHENLVLHIYSVYYTMYDIMFTNIQIEVFSEVRKNSLHNILSKLLFPALGAPTIAT